MLELLIENLNSLYDNVWKNLVKTVKKSNFIDIR